MALVKVVLSPCLLELMSTNESELSEMAHLNHLQSILDYLVNLDVEFDLYEGAPYYPDSIRHPPISRYHYHQITCIQIYAKILKKICYDPIIDLNQYPVSKLISEYDYPERSETKESFLRYITYLHTCAKTSILFIGIQNQTKPRPFIFQISESSQVEMSPISDPAIDCSGQIGTIIPVDNPAQLFPNAALCLSLNETYLQRRHSEDKMGLIKLIGNEVALRNGYCFNKHLSSLNSQKQRNTRVVYSRLGKFTAYLSLDFESGGFEVFDSSGQHLGQYSFSGICSKPSAPKTHKLFFS